MIVLSEYGITDGERRRPRQPRAARGGPARACARSSGSSCSTPARREAFAVADHQVAHVYVQATGAHRRGARAARARSTASSACSTRDGKRALGLDHPRSGELVALAARRSLVHLLLLARRRARARLRAHRRHPSQARLRPGRAVPRPEAAAAEAGSRPATLLQEDARLPLPDGRDPARRLARARLPRPADGRRRRKGPVFITSEPSLVSGDAWPHSTSNDRAFPRVWGLNAARAR